MFASLSLPETLILLPKLIIIIIIVLFVCQLASSQSNDDRSDSLARSLISAASGPFHASSSSFGRAKWQFEVGDTCCIVFAWWWRETETAQLGAKVWFDLESCFRSQARAQLTRC